MFTAAILLALLGAAATTTLAAPTTRSADAGCFEITSFSDGGSPHSEFGYISFQVSDIHASTPLSKVQCSFDEAIFPAIATAPFGTKCSDPSVTFGLEYGANGYYLSIAHTYNSNKTTDSGIVYLGNNISTLVDTFNPNGNYQYLNHSAAFDIGYNRA